MHYGTGTTKAANWIMGNKMEIYFGHRDGGNVNVRYTEVEL